MIRTVIICTDLDLPTTNLGLLTDCKLPGTEENINIWSRIQILNLYTFGTDPRIRIKLSRIRNTYAYSTTAIFLRRASSRIPYPHQISLHQHRRLIISWVRSFCTIFKDIVSTSNVRNNNWVPRRSQHTFELNRRP